MTNITPNYLFEAIYKVTVFAFCVILLLSLAEINGEKDIKEEAPIEPVIETRKAGMPESCHTEDFKRFARLQMITICIQNEIAVYASTTTPPKDWMMHRYPVIVDSLKQYHTK